MGISPGSTGTAMCQQHLRNVLSALDVSNLCQQEAYIRMQDGLFEEDGCIIPTHLIKKFLHR